MKSYFLWVLFFSFTVPYMFAGLEGKSFEFHPEWFTQLSYYKIVAISFIVLAIVMLPFKFFNLFIQTIVSKITKRK